MRSACDRGCTRSRRSYFLEVIRDQSLGVLAASTRYHARLTVASAWFSFTPLASRRCARSPSCDMTSLSSCDAMVSRGSTRPWHHVTHLLWTQLHIVESEAAKIWSDTTRLQIVFESPPSSSPTLPTLPLQASPLWAMLRGSLAIKTRADKELTSAAARSQPSSSDIHGRNSRHMSSGRPFRCREPARACRGSS